MDIVELGQAFRAARLASRQDQKSVAAATGISVPTISRFERGQLTNLGCVRLLALMEQVGLELAPRPRSQRRRNLDDVAEELNAADAAANQLTPPRPQRVRACKGKVAADR